MAVIATLLNNLALLHKAQGRYAEAEPFFRRSLAMTEKALGPEHPHVAAVWRTMQVYYGRPDAT